MTSFHFDFLLFLLPKETSSGLGTGAIVGILIVVFILLLFGVDVTCYFLNKCGLLMCIAVNFCGKSGPSAKGKDIEEGKAAFTWACLFLPLSSVCVPLSDNVIHHCSPIIISPISSRGGLEAGLIVTYLTSWMWMMWILAHGSSVKIREEEERCMLVRNEKMPLVASVLVVIENSVSRKPGVF